MEPADQQGQHDRQPEPPQPLGRRTHAGCPLRGVAASNRQVTSTILCQRQQVDPDQQQAARRTSVFTCRTQAPSPRNDWQNISTCHSARLRAAETA